MTTNLKVYCQECGGGNSYTLQKPNFCQACGQALGAEANSTEPPGHTRRSVTAAPLNETFNPPLMEGLDFEAAPANRRVQTLGEIVDGSDPNVPPLARRASAHGEGVPQQSDEEVLAEFQKEAGSLREKK